jgi:hypothetical protein
VFIKHWTTAQRRREHYLNAYLHFGSRPQFHSLLLLLLLLLALPLPSLPPWQQRSFTPFAGRMAYAAALETVIVCRCSTSGVTTK